MGPSFRRFFLRVITFLRTGRAEAELSREIESHLRMLEDRFVAQGMSAEEARYAARRAFGGVEQAKEYQRDTRTFRWLLNSKLDVKLGLRMLAKSPGLSLVAVMGMAVAIAIASGYFGVISAFLDSPLPLDEGERVVAVRNRAVSGPTAGDTLNPSAQDFLHWRGELKSIQELSAFADANHNLILEGRRAELVEVAEMTASGFHLARVAPLLGRPILEQDERPDALPVVVIGFDEWHRLFNGDDKVLGQTVRLDGTVHTIVGVMPPGFAFPVYHHFWVPLRLPGVDNAKNAMPSLKVFGRLAPGSSLADAGAELTSVGERMAVVFPQTHANLRPLVLAYTHSFIGEMGPEMELGLRALQFGIGLLLLIVAANVAVLVYARTATRMGEIAVRTALGASRARIVTQLFVEALVLSGTAAAIGLVLLRVALGLLRVYHAGSTDPDDRQPFWIQLDFSPGVFFYAAVLAVLAAVIVGALPALKATGKRMQSGLQQFSLRAAGMQLGRTWTLLIVVQVAIAVAALPVAMNYVQGATRVGARQAAPAAAAMFRARLTIAGDAAALAQPMATLIQRLRAEPEVADVTFAQNFPGRAGSATVETETGAGHSLAFETQANRVAPNLFAVFDVPLLAGRGFVAGDERPGASSVIVDQTFADKLGGGNVVGRRIRTSTVGERETQHSQWYEIVGVVPAFGNSFSAPNGLAPSQPAMFQAAAPGDMNPATLVVRVNAAGQTRMAPKLVDIAARVHPGLRVERLESVIGAWKHDQGAFALLGIVIIAVVACVLLLSAAGIYAMMSFTVNSRRREIGIRAALGANARHVIFGVFRRAGAQLGAGVVVGITVATILDRVVPGGLMSGRALVLLPSVAAIMFTVGLLAALGPARRSLAVQPAEALRDE